MSLGRGTYPGALDIRCLLAQRGCSLMQASAGTPTIAALAGRAVAARRARPGRWRDV